MKILCFKKKILQDLGYFEGFSRNKELFNQINQPKHLEWVERDLAEKNPEYKQLIPYILFSHVKDGQKLYFNYERTSKGGEKRLVALKSCAVGGHVEKTDGPSKNAFMNGMRREIKEEVDIPVGTAYSLRFLGLVNDDSNEVGQVHFGSVWIGELKTPVNLTSEDSAIKVGNFETLEWLKTNLDKFETWSQIVINSL